jgi:hypothetical protein
MPLTNTAKRHSPPLAANFICHILPPPISVSRASHPLIPLTNPPHRYIAARLSCCCHQQAASLPLHGKMGRLQREDNFAKWRQRNGIARARVERVPSNTQFLPHPSNGESRGYDIPFCQMMVGAYQAGNPTPNGMLRSIQRWTNHIIPFRITGHKPISALMGQYLLLLVVFKLI